VELLPGTSGARGQRLEKNRILEMWAWGFKGKWLSGKGLQDRTHANREAMGPRARIKRPLKKESRLTPRTNGMTGEGGDQDVKRGSGAEKGGKYYAVLLLFESGQGGGIQFRDHERRREGVVARQREHQQYPCDSAPGNFREKRPGS